jgi:hypothetical protein
MVPGYRSVIFLKLKRKVHSRHYQLPNLID